MSEAGGPEPVLSASQLLSTGAMSGVLARFFTHPMDTVKARLQVQGALAFQPAQVAGVGAVSLPYSSTSDAIRKVLHAEGMHGFYRGFGAVMGGVPLASAMYFGGYELSKRSIEQDWGPTAAYIGAGVVAQAAAGLVYTPTDLVKERLQVQSMSRGVAGSHRYKGSLDAMLTIVRREGPAGMFRGYWTANFLWWPWNVLYFVTYEHLRAMAADGGAVATLPPHMSAACATVASTVATMATTPVDVVKTRLQTLPAGSGGAVAVARALLAQEGPRALFSGASARVLSIAPGSAISFYAFEALKKVWLDKQQQQREHDGAPAAAPPQHLL